MMCIASRRLSLSLSLLILAGTAWGPSARAQQTMQFVTTTSFSDGSGPEGGTRLSRRNLDRYDRILGLSEDQKDAAGALLDGYMAEAKASAKLMQAEMESAFAAFQDSEDHKALGEATKAARDRASEQAAALEKAYFADLRSLLTAEQEEKWSQVERVRRREKGTARGALSGESVDLTQILDDMSLDATVRVGLAEAIEQYESDMDRAIQARDAALEGSADDAPGLGMAMDFSAMQAMMAKAREAGAQVRDVNLTHERRIEVLLPEDRRADFAMAYKRQCFPEVYRASGASRSIDTAMRLADLTSEQKTALEELRASYDREAEPANSAWADAVAAAESDGQDGAISLGGSVVRIRMGDDSGPTADARKARKEIDVKARERLNSILTADQRDRLPKEAQTEDVVGGVSGKRVFIHGGD